ncbi:MAG: hypothetical protein ABEJ25_04165 [Candidatus Bipolaricaulia bacterium]
MHKHRLVLIIFSILLICLSIKTLGGAEFEKGLSVTFEEKLIFTPQKANDLINSETSLTLNASISGIEVETKTDFGEKGSSTGLTRQEVKLGYAAEKFSTNLNAVFDPPSGELNYLLQQVEVSTETIELSNRLLLEYVSEEKSYGAGFETKLSGSTGKGTRLSAAIRFGMDKYLREVHDPTVEGSGYYIITDGEIGPSEFPFGSALIEISNVGIGSCTIANRTKFLRGKGLLFSGFSFDLIDQGPWKTRSYVYFTDEENTVTLVPTLQFGEDAWTVVADFGGKLEGKDSTLDKLVIRGVKFSNVSIGGLKLSGTTALGGKMKKEKGADQLDLRAEDYKLTRSFDEIARDYLYEEVDWGSVLTLEFENSGEEKLERYLALDWYFKSGKTGNFFNVNTFNAFVDWEINQTLGLGTGISINTTSGLEKMFVDMTYDF